MKFAKNYIVCFNERDDAEGKLNILRRYGIEDYIVVDSYNGIVEASLTAEQHADLSRNSDVVYIARIRRVSTNK